MYFRDLAEYLDSKTVVISVFGMSSYNMMSSKAQVIDEFVGYSVFKQLTIDEPEVDPKLKVILVYMLFTVHSLKIDSLERIFFYMRIIQLLTIHTQFFLLIINRRN